MELPCPSSAPQTLSPGKDSLSWWLLGGDGPEMSSLPGTRTSGITGGALDLVQRIWVHVLV